MSKSDDIDPKAIMRKLAHKWWQFHDTSVLPATMLDKEHGEYDLKKLDARLKEAVSKMCEWNKGGDEKIYQLGRQYLRMGLDISVVIEDLQTLFTAVASEYGD